MSRRAQGEGTEIKATVSGKYNAYIGLGSDVQGRRIRKSVTASSKQEVARRVRQLRSDYENRGNRHLQSDALNITVSEILAAFMKREELRLQTGHIKPRTLEFAKQSVRRCEAIGDFRVKRLTPHAIEVWTAEMKGSVTSKRGSWFALRTALRLARREGLTTVDPMQYLTPPPIGRREEAPHATEADVLHILDNSEAPWRTLWLVIAYTGMRTGEARALRWEDISDEYILITRSSPEEDSTKTAAGQRKVPMVPIVKDALDEIRRPEGPVFPMAGQRTTTNKQFRRVAPRGLTPKSLRHGVATRLLLNGTPDHVVQRLLGHASVTITKDIYAHSMASVELDALDKL